MSAEDEMDGLKGIREELDLLGTIYSRGVLGEQNRLATAQVDPY